MGVLDRFIVTNDHDNKVMRQIRSQAGCAQDCGIYQIHPDSTKRRFNIPGPPEADGIETIASVLSIENTTVFNCLVDNARIEQKAVARNLELSEQKLLIKNGNRHEIRGGKIKQVYFLPKGDYWTSRGGSLATFSNDKQLRNTIGVDKSAAIEEKRREETQLKEELRAKKQEESKLQHEHTSHQREWNKAKKAVRANDSRIAELTEKVDSIKDEMEASANVTIDTSEYEEDVQQAEEELEKLRESERALAAQKEEGVPRVREIQSRLDEISTRSKKILDEERAAENDLTQFLETQTQQQSQIEKKRAKHEKYQRIVSQHEKNIELTLADRENALTKARKLHYRYLQRKEAVEEGSEEAAPSKETNQDPTPEDLEAIEPQRVKQEPEYYEPRIRNTKKKIEKERERRNVSREDPAVAFEKYSKARKDLGDATKQIEETEATIGKLQKDLKDRRTRWERFRKYLSIKTDLKFDEMLSLNQYSGSLKFDHDSHALDLGVTKGTSESAGETKDVKALR